MNTEPPQQAAAGGTGGQAGLRISDLRADRGGREVLHGIDLEVPAGQVTALLGANGAGKSSLVLTVGGLVPPTSGAVRLNGSDVAGARPDRVRRLGLSVVPEGRHLLRTLTVRENLDVATYTMSRASAAEGLEYALGLFPELRQRWNQTTSTLSGGQQQMVVLAQALAGRPSVLVVDELSLGLAPVVVRRLAPVLGEVARSGAAVLLIEQFAHVALAVSSTAHVMAAGRIIAGAPSQYWQQNPDALAEAYALGASAAATPTERRTA